MRTSYHATHDAANSSRDTSIHDVIEERFHATPIDPLHESTRGRSRTPGVEILEDRRLLSTLTVLNNHDSGPGSLRSEVAAARSGDTIVFAGGLKNTTITLTSGELAITRNLDIEGPGANKLSISGNQASRVFDVSPGLTVTIAGLTITQAKADHGGAVLNQAGSRLTLSNVILTQNQAASGLGGGAHLQRCAAPTLSLLNSTLSDRWMEISPRPSYPVLPHDALLSVGHRLASGRTTMMEDSVEQYDALIRSGARRLTGYQRRLFQAEVVTELCRRFCDTG